MILSLTDLYVWDICTPIGKTDPRLLADAAIDYDIVPVLRRDHAILLALRKCLKTRATVIRISDVYNSFCCPGIHNKHSSLNQAIRAVINKVMNSDLLQDVLSTGIILWNADMRGTDGHLALNMDKEGAKSLTVATELWIERMRNASSTTNMKQQETIVKAWHPSRSARKHCSFRCSNGRIA